MKRLNLTCLILSLLAITFSCKKTKISGSSNPQNGAWISRAAFPGLTVGEAATFTVNNKAYIATGMNPVTPTQKLTAVYLYMVVSFCAGVTGLMPVPT